MNNPFAEHRELEDALNRSADRIEAEQIRQRDAAERQALTDKVHAARLHEALVATANTEPLVPADVIERIKAAGHLPLVVGRKPPFPRPDLTVESDRIAAGLQPLNDKDLRALMAWEMERTYENHA